MNPTVTAYEPPISTHPMPSKAWHQTTELAPGVRGFTFKKNGVIFIPLIVAVKEGSGDVGRFLDRLSSRCIIVDVTSTRLEGMLIRRGYKKIDIGKNDYWSRTW
jgi:hypothetical protein